MTTKYLYRALGTLCLAIVLLASLLILFSKNGENAFGKSLGTSTPEYGRNLGGDCSADKFSGDLYVSINDEYCNPLVGELVADFFRTVRGNLRTPFPTAILTALPTRVDGGNPPATSTETPVPTVPPTQVVTEIPPTQPPATSTEETPEVKPTKTPLPSETPKPEETKECKNPNQYKEGTSDCNAGKGNG
jgi:hypothetical protein